MAEITPEARDTPQEDPACLLTQIANDHDHIKGLYRQYKAPALSDDQRQRVVWELIRCLCTHIYAEEEVVCPVISQELGQRARDHAMDVDGSLKLVLSDIDAMGVGADGFDAKVAQLMEVFFEHMQEEERAMASLREGLGDDGMVELGQKFEAAKKHVPTRPHPGLPDSILLHIATAPIDYIRDRWRAAAGMRAAAG